MRLALVVIAASLFAAAPARADDDVCAIEGTVPGIEVAVRGERGLRRVRVPAGTRVQITPLRRGIAQVRTLGGETIEGTTRAALRFVLARAIGLREHALELPEGLPLARVEPALRGPWADVDASLGDGLMLRRAPLPCDALRVVSEDVPIVARDAFEAFGPRWRARTERLWVFAQPDGTDALRIDVVPDAIARFAELSRRGAWVRLALRTTLGARVHAWARDTDLVR
ncbi:hypothetical protein [Sandaracinus amylolyticus]|uniref:Secreted protein n=1 Tax=Sandaracinus amylolyticus TaxID=927083 RepID=A0A0F6W1E5_9BACT|nr:hypothetical protein [Sandaracinus amylolyticus]AKF04967.1 hypothetical protein DB32_002116 [Sandaracinus amylolyticus]